VLALERANNELVVMAWLGLLDELPTPATILPERSPEFASNGFVLVSGLGGSPDENGLQTTVAEVQTLAYSAGKARLPWSRAINMWSAIKAACGYVRPSAGWLSLPGAYGDVLVRDVTVLSDPRRLDPEVKLGETTHRFARYGGDIQVTWTQTGLVG